MPVKTTMEVDHTHPSWRVAYNNSSIPQRRALCLNFAEYHRLSGTEAQIENQRATYLASTRQQARAFLRNHISVCPPVLHYQNLPHPEFGGGPSLIHPVEETRAPRTTPVPTAHQSITDSIYDHINAKCEELDGAIRNLTKVALEHIKKDKQRVLTLNKPKALKAELHERNRKYVHHPMRQSLTKVTLNGTPSITLDLPLQRAKTLPENILKLVRSTSDVPQTRFRYQKSDSQMDNLVSSRPNTYQVAYHKEKEKFRSKHSDVNLLEAERRKGLGDGLKRSYGDFGSSSCKGRLQSSSSLRSSRVSVKPDSQIPFGRRPQTMSGLPKLSQRDANQVNVHDQWNRLYDQWSRTKQPKHHAIGKSRTSSFPSIDQKSYKLKVQI